MLPQRRVRWRHRRPPTQWLPIVTGVLIVATLGTGIWRVAAIRAQLEPTGVPAVPGTSPAAPDTGAPIPTVEPTPSATPTPSAAPPEATDAALQRLLDLGAPVYCGGGRERLVALTFDDGPGLLTPPTLDLLKTAGIPATFFLAGKNLEAYPALIGLPRKIARRHAVGDHTWNHIDLTEAPAPTMAAEVGDTQRAIEEQTGVPVRLFRPPFGAHDEAVDALVTSLGMVQVLWSVDSEDSIGATTQEVLSTVLENVRPGSIVLLHENRGTTFEALPDMLAGLRDKGLTPVTVPELLTKDPPTKRQLRSGDCTS